MRYNIAGVKVMKKITGTNLLYGNAGGSILSPGYSGKMKKIIG